MKNISSIKVWFQVGLVSVAIILIMIISSAEAVAQSAPGPPVFPGSPDSAPIDGGLSLLAAAGGAYAWKKLRDKKSE